MVQYYILLSCFFLLSCGQYHHDGKVHIVATTGIIADVLRSSLDTNEVVIDALMGPGVDPHVYKATANDISTLLHADIIIHNGLHLEGKMGEILTKLSSSRPVYAMADCVNSNTIISFGESAHDPHCWFDVQLWNNALQGILKKIAKHYPLIISKSHSKALNYQKKLDSLHVWALQQIGTIPVERRVLITAHDAFGYFSKAYGIRVIGLQGISTLSEYSIQDVNRISSIIVKNRIPSIFVETSLSSRSMEAIMVNVKAMGGNVGIGGHLYSDALGAPNQSVGSYVGMIRHNVQTIIHSLR